MAMSGMTEQIGRVLGGRYRLTAPVGTGSSAQVFLADDVTLRRRVAVKVLHPALAADEAFLRRFRAEARAAAALSHPNLMAVYDWGEDDGPYLVLEFLGGGSLRDMLDAGTRLTPSQAVLIGLDAARALDAAHRRNFVHRDIKPANLLFGDDARLRIADFGLARALSEAAWTEPGDGLVGTARYAAPEQAASPRIDGKADVYSLGLVLIEAVSGRVPLVADTALGTLMCRVDADVPVPPELGPLIPILERTGRRDPAERPDAGGLVRGLLAATRQLDRPAGLPLAGASGRGNTTADPTLLPAEPARPIVDSTNAPEGEGESAGEDESGPRAAVALFDDLAGAGAGSTTSARRPTTTGPVATGSRSARRARRSAPARGRRRRWPWAALALVLAAAAAALAYGTTTLLDREPAVRTAAIPELEGETEEAAATLLAAAMAEVDAGSADDDGDTAPFTWSVSVRREAAESTEAGFVIRQTPEPGAVVAEGETVRYWISLGPPLRVVPELTNRVVDEVTTDLAGAELSLGAVTEVPDEVVEPGRVVTWVADGVERPPRLPKGAEVDVALSAGPAPRTVPALAGHGVDQATADLAALGLVATTTVSFSNTVDAGLVIGSEPGRGETVARGAPVALVVSKGPDVVTVPNVVGMSEADAIAALEGAGLRAGSSTGPAGGLVFEADPGVGATVLRGTEVDLFRRR